MRISTSMIFDAGVASIQRQTSVLLDTQQQVASGRRILSPSDDPVAAARALEVEQAKGLNTQFLLNQKAAAETLAQMESKLASTEDLIVRARTLALQAGNPALTLADRKSIAAELREEFTELLGLANSTDGSGQYLFSGYRSSALPFSGAVESVTASASSEIAYAGDEGQRLMQVAASRQMAVSASGTEVFTRIRNGNGTFRTAAASGNAGSGVIDQGAILDPAKWTAGNIPGTGLKIVFSSVAGTLSYDIQDAASSVSLLSAPIAHTAGQAIPLLKQTAPAADYGAQVVINGTPAAGDSFAITPSGNQSLFRTLGDLINAIEAPASLTTGNTLLTNRLGSALANLDQAGDNVLAVRASIGSRLSELDGLASAGEDLGIQYEQSLSRLQDLDYAAAITQLTQQQTYLEAAQKSFLKVNGLSLFNYV